MQMKAKCTKISYCDLINFKEGDRNNPQALWPQKKHRYSQPKRKIIQKNYVCQTQSKLLQSAVMKIRSQKQRLQAQALQEIMSQSSSNFILSRENTPANHIFTKKKNKHKTVTSDLFDIQSKGSEDRKRDQGIFQGLILYPHLIGLSELVYAEVMGKQKKINGKLMHSWRDCLYPQDKREIYGAKAPYSFSRIFPINELEKGFNDIYGSGKKRCLRAGEESLLIYHMDKYLQKCSKQVMKIARKDYDIINDILKASKLLQLQQLPACMKQVELIWKILATQWRYSGKLDPNNKLLEGALINGRSNFIDLRKDGPITNYLLSFSNQSQSGREK